MSKRVQIHDQTCKDTDLIAELFEQRARQLEQKQANRQKGKRTHKQNKRAKVRHNSQYQNEARNAALT